jgi:hypothetical protein
MNNETDKSFSDYKNDATNGEIDKITFDFSDVANPPTKKMAIAVGLSTALGAVALYANNKAKPKQELRL